MSNNFRLSTLTRAATLSLALAVPALACFAGIAHADDEYGTSHETLVQKSARSAPSFGEAFALATGHATQSSVVARNAGTGAPSISSDASAPPMRQDLLGTGGQQDDIARQTFHPGTGTDW
jgi:hypothetical protein